MSRLGRIFLMVWLYDIFVTLVSMGVMDANEFNPIIEPHVGMYGQYGWLKIKLIITCLGFFVLEAAYPSYDRFVERGYKLMIIIYICLFVFSIPIVYFYLT